MRFSPAEYPLPVNGLLQVELAPIVRATATVDADAVTEAAPARNAKTRGASREPAVPASTGSSVRDPLA